MKRILLVLALLVSGHAASAQMVAGSRALTLDANKKPTQQVSLNSPNWIDQLPASQVSGISPLLTAGQRYLVVNPDGTLALFPSASQFYTQYKPPFFSATNLYVNGSIGNDASAFRGGIGSWNTLDAAIRAALPGDTVIVQSYGNTGNAPSLSSAVTVPSDITIRGDGSGRSRVNVTNAASLVYSPNTYCRMDGILFYGPSAATAASGALVSLNQTALASIKNCLFANFNQTAINAVGVSHTLIQGNTFDHVGGAFLGDDIPNVYNTDFVFDGNTSEWTFSGTYIFHSPNSYNAVSANDSTPSALAYSRTFRITNNVARYAGFGNQAGNGVLAYEIWHGWTGGVIANNTAEDSYFGFSIDRTTNTLVSNNRAQHCTFQFEFNTCTNVTAEDNIADTRPSVGSPFAATSVNSFVIFDGNCADCTWKGGTVVGGYVHFYGSGVRNCSITGAQIKSAFIYAQHPTGNCEVVGNRFSKEVSLPRSNFWLLIDTSADANGPTTIPRLAFSRNTLTDGVAQKGIEYLYANTGTITRFEIENNVSDLAPCGGAYYHAGVEPTITSHSFKGNYTLNTNSPFPNTDDASGSTGVATNDPRFNTVALEQSGNGDVTGDWGAICQSVANALGANGGGIIQLRSRNYNFATKVTLPPGVIVRGNNGGPRQKASAALSTPPQEAPTATGTIISCIYAGGTDTDLACFTLGKGATVRDLSFYEPNQVTSGTPTAYPYCIRMVDYGSNIINVEFINNYRGIDVGSNTVYAGRFVIQNITGNPLFSGLRIDGVGDFSTVDGVHFADTWSRDYADMEAFQQANAVVISVGRADNIQVNNVSSYQYHIGLDLFTGAGNLGAYGVFDKLSFDLSDICVNVRGTGSRQVKISRGIFLSKKYAVYQPGGGGSIMLENCYSGAGVGGFPQWEISGITEAYNCKFENSGQQFVATVHVSSPSAINLQGLSFDLSPQAVGNTGAAVQVDGNGTNGFIPPYYVAYNRSLESPVLASGSLVKIITRASTTGLFTTNKSLATGDNYPTFDANANSVNGANTSQQGLSCNAGGLKTYQAAVYVGNATPGAAITISANVGTTQLKTLAQGVVASNGTIFVSGAATFNYTAAQTVTLNVNVSSGTATLVGNAQTSYATLTDY